MSPGLQGVLQCPATAIYLQSFKSYMKETLLLAPEVTDQQPKEKLALKKPNLPPL